MLRLVRGYAWEGVTRCGTRAAGVALNKELAIIRSQLHQKGIVAIHFRPVFRLVLGRQTIRTDEIAEFSRQLSQLLQAGFALVPALDCLISNDLGRSSMKAVLLGLKLALENGMTFSDGLRQYPNGFNRLYCHLIEMGEQCGTLSEQLVQLTHYYEKLASMKRDIYQALYYPISLFCIACVVIILLFVLVVPKFEELFHTVGATLPPLTRALISSARWIQSYGLLVGCGLLGVGSTIMLFKSRLQNRSTILSDLILTLPWIGSIIHQATVARFCYVVSTSLSADLPILQALAIAREMMQYSIYRKALLRVSESVKNGSSLDQALLDTRCFPSLLIQMVAIGQTSGHLEQNLAQVARLLEKQVQTSVTRMIRLLEPTLLLILGIVIGTLTLALYWPIVELDNVMSLA